MEDESLLMTDRLSLKITQLVDAFSTKDVLKGKYRLVVKQAYTEYTQGAAKPRSPLLYEGEYVAFNQTTKQTAPNQKLLVTERARTRVPPTLLECAVEGAV